MSDDLPTGSDDLIDGLLGDIESFESFPSPARMPEHLLERITKSLVRDLAPLIEAGDEILISEDGKRSISIDEIALRFGRAAILRLARSREPNKAFGFTRDTPGNKKSEVRKHMEALAIAAYVERERRRGRGIDAAVERAGQSLKRPLSKRHAYARLKLIKEMTPYPNDTAKALKAYFVWESDDEVGCFDASDADLDEVIARFFVR